MIRLNTTRILGVVATALLLSGIGTASATSIRLTNPQDWANTSGNEQPTVGDATTGTVNGDSWQSNPALTTGGGQHLLYFQGGGDSSDPNVADPTSGANPQLLFDSTNGPPDNDAADTQVSISQITRVAWDTMRSSDSTTGHWFFDVFTKKDGVNDGDGSYFSHNINFALLDDGSYTDDSWNTLEANKDGNTSSGGPEVQLYEHNRVASGDQGDPSIDDAIEFPARTLEEWTTQANNGNAPDWWDEEILFAAMGTGSNYNSATDTFISNLDNFHFDYDTGSVSDQVSIDLGVPGGGVAVPEPSSVAMLGLGLISLGFAVGFRRRSQAKSPANFA